MYCPPVYIIRSSAAHISALNALSVQGSFSLNTLFVYVLKFMRCPLYRFHSLTICILASSAAESFTRIGIIVLPICRLDSAVDERR